MEANQLRKAYTGFFVDRGHTLVPSSGLIPHHPAAPLFTNAGMNQFFPYILGEEPAPYPRATSVQKNVRIAGKHDDIENIGRTWGHFTFFEMLGNFSFGDYFKGEAIGYAWELLTEVFGLDGDRLWVTVHPSDDEAVELWRGQVGIPADRIQRLEENFWEVGETGPCGPNSEIFFDAGEEFGDAWGPAGDGESPHPRYREIWNLVFMQYDRQPDGSLADLPKKVIDTGMGLERTLTVLQGTRSGYDTDEIRRMVADAERVTGRAYGESETADVALRVITDHARAVTFLVNDGVFPSNEDRGYVLRRILRRAVQYAYNLGVEHAVLPAMVDSVVEVMGEPYPEIVKNRDFIVGVVEREEERFRQTLRSGLAILEAELEAGAEELSGDVVFRLHDTFGFPRDLTREIAAARGVRVDLEGFEAAMAAQRARAKEAGRRDGGGGTGDTEAYRELLEQFGPTEFTGYSDYESKGRVLAVLERGEQREIFLDRTPFYAEGGGQIGDTGTIRTDTGVARVLDTTYAASGLHRHLCEVEGEITPGQDAIAEIDAERRDAIRRNHTGTHLLHWALREVLGPHVRQHGSVVEPDRLRFDFTHYGPVTPAEMAQIEELANARVLANEPVRAYETSKEHAEQLGAIAFFDEKYGEYVRVVEAGTRSMELCGGTHVSGLGMIGPIKVVSEGSIGANLRRIVALTGAAALEHFAEEERLLARTAALVRAKPEDVPDAVERLLERQRALETELRSVRSQGARAQAAELAAQANDGVVVARCDGLAQVDLRDLALAVRDQPDIRGAVLLGSPDGQRVALVAAVRRDSGLVASELLAEAASTVGGGGGRDPEVAVAGGRDATRIDEALEQVRARLS